jgi:hypothetical protein
MNLLENKIPETLRIVIKKNETWYDIKQVEKVFHICFMWENTCSVLKKLFEALDESIWSLEAMKFTNYSLVEEKRRFLSIIIAIAVYNYKGQYSKKDFKFIVKHTTAEDLLTLIYTVKRQLAVYMLYYSINQVNLEKIREALKTQFDKETQLFQQRLSEGIEKDRQRNKEIMDKLKSSLNLRIV